LLWGSQPLLRPILGDGGEGGQELYWLWLSVDWWSFGRQRRLRVSATTFSWPGVCRMSDVNSPTKDNCCHCWGAVQGAWCSTGRNQWLVITWWLTGSTRSLWVDRKSNLRIGLETAASKKVTKKVRSPKVRRWRKWSPAGNAPPSAPEIEGPEGVDGEQCGRMLNAALVSTGNCCLLSSSCRKIMPLLRAFSSRQPGHFLSTGNQA
jgi:hypothetical protein